MANPRQRRKAKSSTFKAISRSKRAKRLLKKMPAIRGPKALQDAWDPSRTVRQNYLAMGLEHDLHPVSSGGSEVNLGPSVDRINSSPVDRAASSPAAGKAPTSTCEGAAVASAIPKGFGRIVRDASGKIARVELESDRETGPVTEPDLTMDSAVVATESEAWVWAHDRRGAGMDNTTVQGQSGLVGDVDATTLRELVDLEKLAASGSVRARHTSAGERRHLARLVSKHGADLAGMARDRRLNPEQRTARALQRAVARAGGLGALRLR